MSGRAVRVNGLVLHCEIDGAGAPIVLLHGNGESGEIFDCATDDLSRDYTVVRPDTRGHGKSESVTEFHYDDMAEDLRELIAALHLKKPVICGFSDGGIVALLLAIRTPELLGGVIACGANTCPQGVKWHVRTAFRALYAVTRDKKLAMMFREPHILPEQLASIPIPVSVIAGEKDMIRECDTRQIAASIPHSRLRILPGETHGSYIVHSEKIATLVREEISAWKNQEKE